MIISTENRTPKFPKTYGKSREKNGCRRIQKDYQMEHGFQKK